MGGKGNVDDDIHKHTCKYGDRTLIVSLSCISRKLHCDPRLFLQKQRNIYTATHFIDDWRLLIGVYRFYENWSTETFRKGKARGGLP